MIQATYNYASGTLLLVAGPGDTSTEATVTLAGTSVTVPLTGGQGTLPLAVDPSIAANSLRGTVANASGVTSDFNVGNPSGPVPADPLQLVAPSASGQPYNLYPTLYATLRAWSFGTDAANLYAALQDLYCMVGILAHAMTAHLLPQATAASWAPITLSANEQNGLSDLQQNVQSELALILGNIYPAGGEPAQQYAELRQRVKAYMQAAQAYQQAVAKIGAANLH